MMRKILIASAALLFVSPAFAQIDVKTKVKDATQSRVESKVDDGINKGLDKAENAIGGLFKKKKKNTDTERQKNVPSVNGSDTIAVKKFQSFSKYDFIPGDKILYFEDFSQDAIGELPALWTTNGGGEVKTVSVAPGHWFHMNKVDAVYCYTGKIAFPENFIVEFDIIPDVEGDADFGYSLNLYQDKNNTELADGIYPGEKGLTVSFEQGHWYTKGYDNSFDVDGWLQGESVTNPVVSRQVNHVILWVQGRRLRIYHRGAKVLDMPTNIHAGTKFNRLRFSGWSSYGTPYVTNIKVTTAATDTRSKLITDGKLVSYGIYFDVNKDSVKPESFGTLSDISRTLNEYPSLAIKIVGHTDGDGDDVSNLDLSKRRAASVKNVLVSQFGIDGSRIQSDGKGETEPVAPNTTSENKAKNRRVEFIKL